MSLLYYVDFNYTFLHYSDLLKLSNIKKQNENQGQYAFVILSV